MSVSKRGFLAAASAFAVVAGLIGASPAIAADGPPKAIAHRGEHANHDENTVSALEAAHRLGAWSEHDVFVTKDDAFVVIHNLEVGPTTDCEGTVTELTLAELRQCRTTPRGRTNSDARRNAHSC